MAGVQFVRKECNELPSSLAGVQFVHKECQCGWGVVCPITIEELSSVLFSGEWNKLYSWRLCVKSQLTVPAFVSALRAVRTQNNNL